MGYRTHRVKSGGTIKQQLKKMRQDTTDISKRKEKIKQRWW